MNVFLSILMAAAAPLMNTMVNQQTCMCNGEFEAMKTPIGRRALRCDKDQFRANMTVST